jgi:hypothetical protein
MKRLAAGALLLVAAGVLVGANRFAAPHTIIQVVTILWKDDSTPEQQQACLEGVRKMAEAVPGIRNIWIKPLKVQGRGRPSKDGKPGRPYDDAFVIEFADSAAADRYIEHPAHLEWNKTCLPIRDESALQQITN